jgi:hypothetical protein
MFKSFFHTSVNECFSKNLNFIAKLFAKITHSFAPLNDKSPRINYCKQMNSFERFRQMLSKNDMVFLGQKKNSIHIARPMNFNKQQKEKGRISPGESKLTLL